MEIKDMTISDVESRMAELDAMVETSENAEEINKATEERALLNERKEELVALETRKAQAKELEENIPDEKVQIIEERKEEKTMTSLEVRSSQAYAEAFANYIKTGKEEECRALLTENVGGSIALPVSVENGIRTAWENSELMGRVRRINVKGNYKVGFEISGDDAQVHVEGSGAVSEETLSLGTVTIIPQSIKKFIRVSDEVLNMRTQELLDYLVDEITYKIVKKAESILVGKIAALTTADATHVSAATVKEAPSTSVIATAIGNLSAEVRRSNAIIVMNPQTFSEFRKIQNNAGYSIDVFESLPVVFSDSLPVYTSASENDVYAIVGDFGIGAIATFPNGDNVEIKIDDKSEMEYDLVRILGRQFVGVEPVQCKAFTLLSKPASI